MKIDVRAISNDAGALMELNIALEPGEIGLESEGFMFCHHVQFEGTVTNISRGVLQLTGNVSAFVKTNCDRCLCETEFEVGNRLDVIFKSSLVQSRNLEFDSDETPEYDDEDEYQYQGYELIPDKALRDAILLTLPVKVLCKEDCKGFCTNCKTNMNETNCKCGDNMETRKSRFEELRKLL
jgi:uncharacterized protein